MNSINENTKAKGSIGIIAIIVIALLVAGGGAYFLLQKSPVKKVAQTQSAINDIALSVPSLDFSASPLPGLNVSALNVAAPSIGGGTLFAAPLIDSNFSYTPAIDIKVPNVQISLPSQTPTQTQQPQVDCSQFSSAPACSYTGAPGSDAYNACKQCYPNK